MSEIVVLTDCRSPGCRDWVRSGRPYSDSKPIAQFAETLRGHGFTVYTYPDRRHLVASRPEDHTPFSATGWPTPAPRWIGNACDQMPRNDSKAALDELAEHAEQVIRDKDAGLPGTEWIKYLNYTDKAGRCWHVAWQPNKVVTPSADKGHNHFSGRSDWVAKTPTKYDPIARAGGLDEEDDMGASLGPIEILREGITSLTIPPVEAGAADPRPTWINFCNATGDKPYSVRVWYSTGTKDGWAALEGDGWVAGERTIGGGERVSVQLKPGTAGLDIRRTSKAPYGGHLTVVLERGAVKR